MTAPQTVPDPFTAAVVLQVAVDQLTQPGTVELDRDIPVEGTTAYQLAADDRSLEEQLWVDLRLAAAGRDRDAGAVAWRGLQQLDRRRAARTATGATLPSLLQQLQDAVPNGGDTGHSSPSAGSARSPIALAALDLLGDIIRVTRIRAVPTAPSLAEQLRAWVGKVSADDTQVFTATDHAAGVAATDARPARPGWPDRARAILDPPKKWTAAGACPDCHRDTAWVLVDGERVRRPAIEFDVAARTARCLNCPARWDTEDKLRQLEKVLTTPQEPPDAT